MNTLSKCLSLFLTGVMALQAGGINVVHLGPQDVVRFQASAGEASQDFDLQYAEATGPFLLPDDKPAKIKATGKDLPDLELEAKKESRIAVLHAAGDAYDWKTIPSESTDEKWSLRIVNLSAEPAKIVGVAEVSELAPRATTGIHVESKQQLVVKIQDSIQRKYKGEEPCAVVALLYRSGEEWKILFVADR